MLQAAAAGLFNTLLPSDCRLCGLPLQNISRLPVCTQCLATVQRQEEKVCTVCGERLPQALADEKCGLCRRVEQPFVKAAAYGSYEGSLRGLLQLLKYEGVRPAATLLGQKLAEVLRALPRADRPRLVVPVPLHAVKLRQRSFNQSELLASVALRKLADVGFVLATDVLVRTRATVSQTGLTRHQRRENVRGAFAVRDVTKMKGRDIVLVDDVFTTGTTAAECARVLRRAGAGQIFVATVARVQKPEVAELRPIEPQGFAVAAQAGSA